MDVAMDGSGDGAPRGAAFRGHSDVLAFIIEPCRGNVEISAAMATAMKATIN